MKEFKSGYVSIVGETNAGKSTLLNGLMGEKLAIVSPKVQTTRNNIKGIYTDKNKQIIFIDTPGIHKVNSKLSSVMIDSAITSIKDANIVLFVVAGNKKSLSVFDYNVLKKLKEAKEKNKNLHIIGIINKIDRIKKEIIIEKIKLSIRVYGKNLKLIFLASCVTSLVKTNCNINSILSFVLTFFSSIITELYLLPLAILISSLTVSQSCKILEVKSLGFCL